MCKAVRCLFSSVFFFNDTATTEIYTLSLHDALPIRRWWAGSREHVAGEHYRLQGANPGPPPAHEIGIWLGAYGPRMLRVTGELADGWVPSLPRLPRAEVAEKRPRIDAAAE